jgi:hypothetical protein
MAKAFASKTAVENANLGVQGELYFSYSLTLLIP